MNKLSPLWLLTLLIVVPASAAPAKRTLTSSPSQVNGILSRVTDLIAARRDAYWHQGDYPRVIALDRIVTAADPSELECYETGGWLMESLGDLKDAEAYYRQGVANNPRTEESYFHLAFFYFGTRHDYGKAANTFRLATRQQDAGINDWKMLAHSYDQLHEYGREVATWRHIKARWPKGVAVDHNLSRALALQQAATGKPPAP